MNKKNLDQETIELEEELESLLSEMKDEDEEKTESKGKKEKVVEDEDEDDKKVKKVKDEDDDDDDEDDDEDQMDEAYKAKAQEIFETAVDMRVSTIREELEAEFEVKLDSIHEDLEDKIDEYAQYVVNEWYSENEFKVQSSLRTELSENFIDGLKDLFNENYFHVPEEKEDLCEALGSTVSRLKGEKEELIEELDLANFEILETKKSEIINKIGGDLFENQKAKLCKLAESIDASDVEDFQSKLSSIKDVFFSESAEEISSTVLDEGKQTLTEENHGTSVSQYASFLSKNKTKF